MKPTEISEKIDESLYYMQNDTLRAIEIFDEILEIEPENIDAINGKGSSLMKLNRMNEAEKYFDYSLSIQKTSSSLISKGLIHKNRKDYEKALYYYDEAIEVNSDLSNIITILKNEIHELIDDGMEINLKNYNKQANELINQGRKYRKSNKLWDAFDCYQKAMKIDENCENSVHAMINEIKNILQNELMIKTPTLGKSRIDQLKLKSLKTLLINEDPQQALKIMNMILETDENEIDTLNQKGCILFFYDECADSIECFDKCLKLDDNYDYALFNKAIVLRRINKLEESLKCLDKLLKTPKYYEKVKPYQLEILDKLHEKNK